ncbi:dipeptide epimerase [Chromatiales bacterium (ex Bugula neritina AB1)]|nr:dipeptide epimerase [Chromatiales bacterium (ex Bugula neritina AB1)]
MRSVVADKELWPISGTFTISRGSKTAAEVVTVGISEGGITGWGECVPYARYGESPQSVLAQVDSIKAALESSVDRLELQQLLPAGAARNAVDCALWDLQAKQSGLRAWSLAGIEKPAPVITAYTLSLDSPEAMQAAASEHSGRPLLKLKLAGEGDLARVSAVRAGAPDSKIIVDANEGWSLQQYHQMVPELLKLNVAMIEQPMPAGEDASLDGIERMIPLCADESCHDASTLADLAGRYDVVNIKLDKTGGLTEALALRERALDLGFDVMVGCMIATSLAMAPATLLTPGAVVVDLDGPLLLAGDRPHALDFDNNSVAAPESALWG